MKRDGSSILAGTLLLSFLFSPGMRSTPEATGQSDSSTGNDSSGAANHWKAGGAYELSPDDHKRIHDSAVAEYREELRLSVQDACELGDKKPNPETANCPLDLRNFIIAVVPDPVHTHLGLQFDRSIEVIEEALQDEHYMFVHSTMPWASKSHPESDDHSEREATEFADESKQEEPGLMIFRAAPVDDTGANKDTHSPRQPNATSLQQADPMPTSPTQVNADKKPQPDASPLLVLVVGESPTRGIHKDQFNHAVAEMETWLHQNPQLATFKFDDGRTWTPPPSISNRGDYPGLRIFGPTFSGSLTSLKELLQCPGDSPPQPCHGPVSIHSGTVSSYSSINEFIHHQDPLHARFLSFQESDDVIVDRFQQFLTAGAYGERHYDAEKIALLSEDETAYGKSDCPEVHLPAKPNVEPEEPETMGDAYENMWSWFTEPVREAFQWLAMKFHITHKLERLTGELQSGSNSEEAAKRGGHGHTNLDENPCPINIYFPREISQLRAAYQKDVISTAPEGRSMPRDILPSYSDVPGSDDDTVATYSAHQMPLSQEGVMLGIVSELKKHQIQFVIVRATDPMDALFLIRYLRTMYPQGRIVTLGADMLLRREAEDPRFHGLLSLATYALSTAANHGFRDYEEDHIERVFPSSFEAGSYNAVRSLLVAWQVEPPASCYTGSPSSIERVAADPSAVEACRYTLLPHAGKKLSLYQYGWRQQPLERDDPYFAGYDAPPVRLLAVGRDQYWPVAALGPFPGEKRSSLLPRSPYQLVKPLEPVHIPNSWRVVQLAGVALAVFFCWSLWCSSIFSNAQPLARFAPAIRDRRLSLILVAGFTLIFILLILMWPALHGATNDGLGVEPFLLVSVIAVFSLTLVEGITRTRAGLAIPETKEPSANHEAEPDLPHASSLPPAGQPLVNGSGVAAATALARDPQYHATAEPIAEPAFTAKPIVENGPAVFASHKSSPSQTRRWWTATWNILKTWWTATWNTLKTWWPVILFFLGCVTLFVGVGIGEHAPENSALVRWYSMLRTVQLTSGLSFILPTFFFLTVWLWWAEQLSSGLVVLDERHPRLPVRKSRSGETPKKKKWNPFDSLNEDSFPELLADITPRRCSWRWLLVGAIVLACFAFLMGVSHPIMSLEKPLPLEAAMTALFVLAICGIIVTTLRTWKAWSGLRKLLLNLDMTPLRDTFKSMEGFSWKPIWRFGAGSLPDFLRLFSRQREAMEEALRLCPHLPGSAPRPSLLDFRDQVQAARATPHRFSSNWLKGRKAEREVLERFGRYQKDTAELAGSAIDFIVAHADDAPEVKKHSALRDLIPYLAKEKDEALRLRQRDEKLRAQISACQHFACISYVNVLLVMLVRIRTLIVAVGGMYVLTLVGISQYPFEPKGALQLLLVVLLAFVISIVGLVFAQIHRDTVLSNLTDTNPGELGIDFYIRMGTFVALPLLSLLASQFPSVNRFFYSWLQPALESLNR